MNILIEIFNENLYFFGKFIYSCNYGYLYKI